MRMYKKLPHFVYLKNEKFFINADFRIFIEFEKNMQDRNDKKVIYNALESFYPSFYKICEKGLIEEAINKFIWFYLCGREQINNTDNKPKKGNSASRIYDYEFDEDLIWSAFFDRGIDLTNCKLHWWKFKALLNSMSDDCMFKKVIGYRCYNGDNEDLLQLKELYKLPPTKFETDERKRQDKIAEKLNEIASQNRGG